jgi:NodT family efflux transporter outer membrane factor (OMF) lipoprotein
MTRIPIRGLRRLPSSWLGVSGPPIAARAGIGALTRLLARPDNPSIKSGESQNDARQSHRRLPFHANQAATACVLLLLGACTVGPQWHRPPVPGPTAFAPPAAGATAPSQAISAPLDPSWWDVYGDAELSDLEHRVAAENLDVAEATARLGQSRAETRIAGADQYPSADMNASYARERASPNGILGLLGTTQSQTTATVASGGPGFGPSGLPGSEGSPGFNLWQYGFDASWELDLWGRVRRTVEASRAAQEAAEDARRGVLVSVLAETARDYLTLRGVQAKIAITRQNLDTATRSLSLTHVRFANGATTSLDVANAAAQVDTIRADLPMLERQAAQLVNAISFMVGAAPRTLAAELATPKPIPPVPPEVAIGLPSELAERRPDIREAEARLHEATAGIGVAAAGFYPSVTLSGSLDIQALQFTGLGMWNSRQYGIGPAISLPLFEGGRLHGMLQLRKAQQQEAAIAYKRTVLKAWQDVDDALTAYNAMQDRRDRLKSAVQQDTIALAAAQLQYSQGSIDFLNVLTVQDMLLGAQSALVQATADTDVTLARLYKALGGGWQQAYPVNPHADRVASQPMPGNRQPRED